MKQFGFFWTLSKKNSRVIVMYVQDGSMKFSTAKFLRGYLSFSYRIGGTWAECSYRILIFVFSLCR